MRVLALAVLLASCAHLGEDDDGDWMDGDVDPCNYEGRPEMCDCMEDLDCQTGLRCVDRLCTPPGCGDGIVDPTEECDDGNADPGDGCEPDCVRTPPGPSEPWERTFHVDFADVRGEAVAADALGNVFVTGSAWESQVWTRSYDPAGGERWTDASQQGLMVSGYGVAVDAAGDVYVVGDTGFVNEGTSDVWLRKYDGDGSEIWTRTFDGAGTPISMDVGFDLALDAEGNPIVAGTIAAGDGADVWLRKYDPDGEEIWTRTVDGGGFEAGRGVAVDSGGGIWVVGDSADDVWLRRYDADGAETFTRTVDGGGLDVAWAVAAEPGGGAIVVANVGTGLWLRKYDAAGEEVWTVTDSEYDGEDVAVDAEGRIAVTGWDGESIVVREYDAEGLELWGETFDAGAGNGVAYTADGYVLATGFLRFGDPDTDLGTWSDLWVAKIAPAR